MSTTEEIIQRLIFKEAHRLTHELCTLEYESSALSVAIEVNEERRDGLTRTLNDLRAELKEEGREALDDVRRARAASNGSPEDATVEVY